MSSEIVVSVAADSAQELLEKEKHDMDIESPAQSSPGKLSESKSMRMLATEVSPEYALHALTKFFVGQKTYGYPGSDGSILSCIKWRILEEHDIICIPLGNLGASMSKLMKAQVLFTGISFNYYLSGLFTLSVCPDFCDDSKSSFGFGLLVSLFQFIYIKIFRSIVELPCVHLADFETDTKWESSPSFKYIKSFSWIMTIVFAMLSIWFFVAGNFISKTLKEEHDRGNIGAFIASLPLSYAFTQPLIDSIMVTLRYDFPSHDGPFAVKFFHQKPAFKEHFDHFFINTKDAGCYSLSQLGRLAKKNWFLFYKKQRGRLPTNEDFLSQYPKFDRKFRIGDSLE